MREDKTGDRDFETWMLLAQTRRAMFRARSQGLLKFGISPRQAALMFMIIALGKKATPSELARNLFREPHSISELVDRMEKVGLVKKVSDLDKKNLVRIELTEKGHDIYQRSVSEEPVHKVMASLSEKEHRQLQELLRKLWGKALEQLGIEVREPFQRNREQGEN